MVELVLVIFVLCMATLATMAIKTGLKLIDFMLLITDSIKRIEARQNEIAGLLRESHDRERGNVNP